MRRSESVLQRDHGRARAAPCHVVLPSVLGEPRDVADGGGRSTARRSCGETGVVRRERSVLMPVRVIAAASRTEFAHLVFSRAPPLPHIGRTSA